MPIYDYACDQCGKTLEHMVPMQDRDNVYCPVCGNHMHRPAAAPMGKIAGRVAKGGGADRFTADMLGIPLKELPIGLRSAPPK